jgi:arsenite methyltransferase
MMSEREQGCCGQQDRQEHIRHSVRGSYAEAIQERRVSCCGDTAGASSCCGEVPAEVLEKGLRLGYSLEEVASAPEIAAMSFGCGNPEAIAALQPGEVVLDLGSGGGFDCFLAAKEVGESGRVIGVDMTPEMLSTARENARRLSCANVEFRLGEIEHLPVADNSVDVIISNCVINLSPDKEAVFNEAFRVLKPGGRLAIADVVATALFPEEARQDMALWSACASGAALIDDLQRMLRDVGFVDIRIQPRDESREMIREWVPGSRAEEYVVSATIEAIKPKPE